MLQAKPLFTAQQVRTGERIAAQLAGIEMYQLMLSAGEAVFEQVIARYGQKVKLLVLCGGGNNGGDGYVVAKLALQQQMTVNVVAVKDPSKLTGDALKAYEAFIDAGGQILSHISNAVDADVIVDAMLGTGLRGDVSGEAAEIIEHVNARAAKVVAVDVPSGLCSDTGRVLGCCVKANVTVTFIGIKQGLVTGQARSYVGELVFAGLGVQQEFEQTETASASWEFPSIIAKLNQREACVHKGSLGKALVVGGDYGMGGAILIASRACLKAGAGLTACLTDERNISSGLVVSPEVMFAPWSTQRLIERLQWSSAVALGPGLGQSDHAEELFELVSRSSLPKVFDADALNLFTTKPNVDANRIITPHPGEAARLLNCSVVDVENNRYQAARDLSKKYGGVAILKGAGTVIDDGQHRYVCAAGNAGMATGGMGDALTGIIVALLAQGFTLSEAARMGVMLHSYAADLNVKQQGIVGLSAMDVVNTLRKALSVTANDHSSPVT